MFDVGMQILCVDDRPAENPWHRHHPLKKGRIYTVHETVGSYIGIDASRRLWEENRFQPLGKRETSISFAHKILRKANRKRSVDA